MVVLDRGLCLYNRRGELVTEAPFGTGESLVTMDLTADGVAFLLAREGAAVGQDHRLVVLNGKGEVALDRFISERVRSVAVAKGALFIQTPTHIKKIALSDGTEWEREQIYDGERMMVYNAENVVLFSSNKAWFVSFEGAK